MIRQRQTKNVLHAKKEERCQNRKGYKKMKTNWMKSLITLALACALSLSFAGTAMAYSREYSQHTDHYYVDYDAYDDDDDYLGIERIRKVRNYSNRYEIEFYDDVRYSNSYKVTVKDSDGNSYKTTVKRRDDDELIVEVQGLKSGTAVTFTVSGVRLEDSRGDYGTVSKKVTIS